MTRKTAHSTAKKRPARKPAPKAAKKRTSKRGASSTLRDFCRSLPGTTEDIKWGDNLIFSVGDKMYAGFDADAEHDFAFKSEEEEFMGLIQVKGMIPAPYMAKHFWVAVRDRTVRQDDEWKRLLQKAHALVLAKLSARRRLQILGECH